LYLFAAPFAPISKPRLAMTILSTTIPTPTTTPTPVAQRSHPRTDSWLAHSKIPQGQTDELITWLSKVHQKKAAIRSGKSRDLRKEAVLEAARLSAQTELEKKQRERLQRWRQVMPTVCQPRQSVTTERDESLCDCESCFLCQRHRHTMYGKCYCNVIFSPRPVFMDFSTPVSASEAFSGDDVVSKEADAFLASLSMKRKGEMEERLPVSVHKRAKA